jgi:hypothetical protein
MCANETSVDLSILCKLPLHALLFLLFYPFSSISIVLQRGRMHVDEGSVYDYMIFSSVSSLLSLHFYPFSSIPSLLFLPFYPFSISPCVAERKNACEQRKCVRLHALLFSLLFYPFTSIPSLLPLHFYPLSSIPSLLSLLFYPLSSISSLLSLLLSLLFYFSSVPFLLSLLSLLWGPYPVLVAVPAEWGQFWPMGHFFFFRKF